MSAVCIYEQQVTIKPKENVKDYKKYAEHIINPRFAIKKIKKIERKGELINIKLIFQSGRPITDPYSIYEFKPNGDPEFQVTSIKTREILRREGGNLFQDNNG